VGLVLRKVRPALAHRLFYPGVAAVLAARSGDTVAAMPVVSYSALSEKPPLFGVSCARDSFTLRTSIKAGEFSISLLGDEYVGALSELASRKGRVGADKLHGAGLIHTKGAKLGAPIILGSAASVECKLLRTLGMGDHVLLVGRIESATANDDFRDYWRFASYRPILYTGWKRGMMLYRPFSRRKK
jgi:flavin reductase (DIM6/NTAB) family NADH-FMN oxidoreductase RutF